MDSGGKRGADTQLAFASLVFPREGSETNAILLAESIRSFAGGLSENPINFYTPGGGGALSHPREWRAHSPLLFPLWNAFLISWVLRTFSFGAGSPIS